MTDGAGQEFTIAYSDDGVCTVSSAGKSISMPGGQAFIQIEKGANVRQAEAADDMARIYREPYASFIRHALGVGYPLDAPGARDESDPED